MSLNWNVEKVSEQVRLIQDPDSNEMVMNPVTNALIWATMEVGIGEITSRNAKEFYIRLHAWELALGSYLKACDEDGNRKDYLLTPTDVVNHIGLSTNVAYENATTFKNKLMRNLLRIAGDRWDTAQRAALAEVTS